MRECFTSEMTEGVAAMAVDTKLAERMIARADADRLEADHPLRTLAAAFTHAAKLYYSTPQGCGPRHFMAAWARARIAWCNYAHEELIP